MATDPNNNVVFPGAPSVGLRNVGSYQVSGVPWVTGSDNLANAKVHMIEFPYVTKKLTVLNITAGPVDSSAAILVHFASGSGTAAVTIPGDSGAKTITPGSDVIAGFHYAPILLSGSLEMNVKCKKAYISNFNGATSAYVVIAELTNIPTSRMPHLTGSGITDSPV